MDGDVFGYKIIAAAWGTWHGWCAFRAPTGWSDDRALAEGDEIPKECAELLFPALANSGRIYSNC